MLIRSIDYGGQALTQALTADGAIEAQAAWSMVQEADAGMADICRASPDASRHRGAQFDWIF